MDEAVVRPHPEPWNKGKLVGQKAPFKLKEIWAIRIGLQLFRRVRELALFDRRTKASLIYRRTKNLRAVQLLLGHTRPRCD